jgi:hypothetical protein
MAKDGRYDLDGADDGLGDSTEDAGSLSSDQGTETSPEQESPSEQTNSGSEDIPHRVRYDSPQEGREPLNLHVDLEDKQRLRELTGLAEEEFEETVWETDVKLAVFRCDITDDEAFLREMENIGYGYFD